MKPWSQRLKAPFKILAFLILMGISTQPVMFGIPVSMHVLSRFEAIPKAPITSRTISALTLFSIIIAPDSKACVHDHFRCKNGGCISKDYVCNSRNNCGDYSDELSRDSAFCFDAAEAMSVENSKSNTRSFNSILKTGDYLQSKNGILKLQLNSNGNLVLYCKDKEIWSTNTSDNSVECLHFGKNRTLSLRKKGNISIWEAEFLGIDSDPKDLTLQDDGNLAVYDECGEILWESKTSGKCNAIPVNVSSRKLMEFTDILYSNKGNNACDIFFCYMAMAFPDLSP